MSPPNKKRKMCHEDPHDIVARCVKDSTMLTMIVGPQRERIMVHRKLACHFCGYFRGIYDGPASYSENELGEVVWDDEDANVVKLFVSWLYSQRINLLDHGVSRSFEDDLEVVDDVLDVPEDDKPDDVEEKKTADFRALLKLWIFADKRCIPTLGNLAITELYKENIAKWVVDLCDIVSAWNSCAPNSKLRSFIVDSMSLTTDWLCFNHESFDLPTSFLTAIVRKTDWQARNIEIWKQSWANLDLCQYHEHEEGTRCGPDGKASEGSDSEDEQQHGDSSSDE